MYLVPLSSLILMGLIVEVFGRAALLNVTVCFGGVDGDKECNFVVHFLSCLDSIVLFSFLVSGIDTLLQMLQFVRRILRSTHQIQV